MKRLWITGIFALVVLLALPIGNLYAQATASLLGIVHDASGAVIPGAQVTVLNQQTGATRTVPTDSTGSYEAPFLPVGQYTVRVTFQGFNAAEQKDVVLQLEEHREIDFTLTPSNIKQSVEVSAIPVAVNTTSPTLGQVIPQQQVADLPLNGRDFVELAILTPGATTSYAAGDFFNGNGGGETAIRGSYSLSVGGSRESSTDWRLDGMDNNELSAGAISILPSIDAIQEFNVLTFNYSAEYGRRGGPTVLVTLKNGTNQYHGTLFEFHRNNAVDARSFFATSTPKYIENTFGGSIGGPIQKDKTFFFFDFQDTRYVEAIPNVATVPTALMRQGVFTEFGASVFNPASPTRQQFFNNTIPACQPGSASGSCISPIGQALVNFFPLPNVPGTLFGDYVSQPIQRFAEPQADIRLDHTFSSRDSAWAHFSYDQAGVFEPSGLPGFGAQPGGYFTNRTLTNHDRNVAISETHLFSPTLINQVTAGYNREFDFISDFGTGSNESEKLGIPGSNLGTDVSSDLLAVILGNGFWGLEGTFSPFQGGTNVYQVSDSLEYIRGNHHFQIGGGFWANQLNILTAAAGQGFLGFTGEFTSDSAFDPNTGSPIADLLVGIPTFGEHDQTFQGVTRGHRWKQYRPYIEDDWKARPDLTLNLGFAYNYTTPITENHNRQSNFDFATGTWLIPGVNAGGSAGVNPYYGGLEPRFGFSWSPRGSTKTAVRGGYGIFHDSGFNQGSQDIWENPPYFGSFAFFANGVTPVTTLSQGFPILSQPSTQSLISNPLVGGNAFNRPFDYPLGTIQQWNLNVQREVSGGFLFTVGYAASRSAHLTTDFFNLNIAPPGPLTTLQQRRPYPAFNNIFGILPRGQSRYDSLQLKAETRRAHHGFYALLSYTYAKGFDNGLGDNLGTPVGIDYFPLNQGHNADKGLNSIDLTHQFTGSFTYDLPFGRGQKWASTASGVTEALLGGWQTNGILHFTSGSPLYLSVAIDESGTGLGNRPDRVCNGALSNPTVNEWFNTSCFANPAPGTLGNSTRTPLFGPPFKNVDFSLFKRFPLPWREGMNLEFRTEVFNLLNTPQFALPGTSLVVQGTNQGGFGQIFSTVNNPRLIQFALKLIF
ncbi:MAG TPA: carboxypeptidase-like regulatory domain-containing protein [Terriglobia bacterium]|nr:carboxypeptidase-like regulatory domain-containing protein [Terriglobia bacterium]